MHKKTSTPFAQLQLFMLVCVAVAAAALTSGCGGTDFGDRAPVNGSITIDGRPVTGGRITFMPAKRGPAAFGTIDEKGHYELTTDSSLGKPDGAVVGKHKVLIDGRPIVAPGAIPPPSQTPLAYADASTSKLDTEVKPEQTNEIDFQLSSRGP